MAPTEPPGFPVLPIRTGRAYSIPCSRGCTNSTYGTPLQDYDAFYSAAKGMMYNPAVTQAFTFSAADSTRYGVNNTGTSFGNACLVAKQILAADQGTRFIQISFGSWDMHSDIYGLQNA